LSATFLILRTTEQDTGVLISPYPDQEENNLGSMSGTLDFNNIETRDVINFFFLQGKTPKEIHAILTEKLACFLSGRAKDLSTPLYDKKMYIGLQVKYLLFLPDFNET